MKTKLTLIMLIAGFLCAQSQTWSWSEDTLSYARSGFSATVLDDTVFFSCGKVSNYNYPGIIDIYDIGEDEWTTYEIQSPKRKITSSISCNGMVFFAGGNNNDPNNPSSTFFSEIDVFTKETGEWTIDSLSEERQNMGIVASGNKVYFAGWMDYDDNFNYHNVIDIYDTETKTWLPPDSLSISKCLMGAVAACGKLFFAGGVMGIQDQEVTDVVDIYDMETGEWTIENLSVARGFIAAVAYEGLVYFAGGTYANNTGSNVIDIYNCEDGTWDIDTLSGSRVVTAHNVYDALVFTGMFNSFSLENWSGYNANGTVDVYYPATGQWDYTVPALDPARYFYANASYDNKIYIASGSLGGGIQTNTVNILEYDTTWTGSSNSHFHELAINVHPNPFTTTLQVDFNLQHPGKVNIAIYNNLGAQVEVLLTEYKQQGDQQVVFNAEILQPGIYYFVLKTNEGIQTTKIIKL